MPFDETDLVYYLSGGTANTDPYQSLGGPPSATVVNDSANALFTRVPQSESSEGADVYRCMYVINEGSSTLEQVKIYLEQDEEKSTIYAAVYRTTEVQRLTITGEPLGGDFTLTYTCNVDGEAVSQTTDPIVFDVNMSIAAQNMEDRLNELDHLSGVQVSGLRDGDRWNYTITFGGDDDYRDHQLLEVEDDDLIGFNLTIGTLTVTDGNPVNSVAADIGFENQPPAGVEFSQPSSPTDAISVGRLKPLDGFHIWLLRTTPAGLAVEAEQEDEVTINIIAKVEE